ncbi:MAG: DUF3857 domain-containing protein [Bryobacterales bacterium]|nr:DUF3857 domain-containing protein [Bryobacterales bacterium]
MRPVFVALCAAVALFGADELPAWARDAASKSAPAYPAKTPAVVLFQEETLTVEPDGRRLMQERAVIRKLTTGRVKLNASRAFNVKNGRIRDIRAWVINPSGKEIKYGKDRVVEAALDSGSLYDEARIKMITPGDDWETGAAFAYEIIEEERTLFTQYPYSFQSNMPALLSRFVLTLPVGWEAKGQVLNRAPGNDGYTNTGTTHTWELRDLPWFEDEEMSPDAHVLTPRLALNYFPSNGAAGLRPLKDWAAVSGWVASLSDSQSQLTPALEAKAAQLTAGAATPLEKIRAIAAFVQQTTYISVQMNLTRGGGYTPHPAADVLAKNYGDCKDKANLMKALLAAAGIGSHLVAIYSGARDFVRPEWPSTMQFNHMIIAVRAPDGVTLPTIASHETLGRLLFFDPTDPYTPVGDLPDDEQGSHALVVAGDSGALVRVPRAPATANRVTSETNAVLNTDGGLVAQVQRQYFGQTASGLRSLLQQRNDAAIRKMFEYALTRQLGGLKLDKIEPADSAAAGRLDLRLAFTAQQFGKLLKDRLLILAPGALLSGSRYSLPAKADRKLPVQLEAEVRQDRVAVQVPDGFQLDELPDPVQLKTSYGEFTAKWKMAAGKVEMEQALEIYSITAPPAEYAKVRAFFEQIGGATTAAVVLVKK